MFDLSTGSQGWKQARFWVAAAGLLALAQVVAYAVRLQTEDISTVWFPAGMLMAFLLVSSLRRWPGLMILALLVDVAYVWGLDDSTDAWYWALAFAGVNVAGHALGAGLLVKLRPHAVKLFTVSDVVAFLAAAIVGSLAAAAAGSAVLQGLQPNDDWFYNLQMWWTSDLLAMVIVVPMTLLCCGPSFREPVERGLARQIEVGVLLLALPAAAGLLLIVQAPLGHVVELPLLAFPILIWAALRFSPWLVSTLTLILTLLLVSLAAWGQTVFSRHAPGVGIPLTSLHLQAYLLVVGVTMLILSISVAEQRRSARRLADNQSWFRLMAGTLPQALWLREWPSQRLVYLSPTFHAVTGYMPQTVLGRPQAWRSLIHPDDRTLSDAAWQRISDQGQNQVEYRLVKPDGSTVWVREQAARVYEDGKESPRQTVGSLADITEQHQARQQRQQLEQELRDNYDRFRRFMDISGESIWSIEFDTPVPVHLPFEEFLQRVLDLGYVDECNQTFAQTYGFTSPEAARGSRALTLFRLNDRVNRVYFRRFHASGATQVTGEAHRRGRDASEQWFLINLAGDVEDGQLHRVWGTLTDITALRDLGDQLREAQKMEAVGELASGVAHDFNNLLTVIAGHVELVEQQVDGNEHVHHSLGVVREAIDHAAAVARSLLTFGRRTPGRYRAVNLAEVLRQTQRLVSRSMPATVELELDLPDHDLPRILGDAVQLQQVFLNLAINARDALESGTGRIIFAAEECKTQWMKEAHGSNPRAPQGNPAVNSGGVRVVVRDTGRGMDEATRQRVFEPFFTTKPVGSGTGLGLAVAHSIVQEHAGSIAVSSRVGEGTTFIIELPALVRGPANGTGDDLAGSVDDENQAAGAAASETEQPGKQVTGSILLAEDEPQVRAIFAAALVARGYDVVQVGDGQSLLEVYRSHLDTGGTWAAIISDIDMPKLTGLEALRRLRKAGAAVPAILVSGSVEFKLDPTVDGNTIMLYKPFRVAQLCRLLESRLSPSVAPNDLPQSPPEE